MSTTEPVTGYLVVTAINSADGKADSETFAVIAAEFDARERTDRFTVTDGDGFEGVITLNRAGTIPPEVRPYRELIQALIAADEPCMGVGCGRTMLGHLLASMTPEQIAMVKALDPDHREDS